jgi:YidC/Oxa1 family membrane protein insertase
MDTKRLVTALVVGLTLILLYLQGVRLLDHYEGWDKPQASSTAPAATEPSTTQSATGPASQPAETVATTAPTTGPSTGPSISAATSAAQFLPAPEGKPSPATLGSGTPDDPKFALQLKVDPGGAGLTSVVLNSFKGTAASNERYTFETPTGAGADANALASRGITIDIGGKKTTYDLAAISWTRLEDQPRSDIPTAVYGADLMSDHNVPLLTIRKKFTVFPRQNANEGYEVRVDYAFTNQTQNPITIHTTFNGPTLPPPETYRTGDRGVVAGYEDKGSIDVEVHQIEEFKAGKKDDIDLTKDSKGRPARWAGGVSNYFGAVLLPQDMLVGGKPSGEPRYIASIIAHGTNLASESDDEHRALVTFETTDIKLAPKTEGKDNTVTLPLSVYLGPKWRKVIDTPYYAAFPRVYGVLLIISSSFCGMSICSFGWMNTAITALLTFMHFILHDWGLAIIGLVAIVRLILHPITRQSQISMSKMSKMGPEMKRLQEKYKDDKEALNKAMVDFHKQQGLGPYLGCLPMFLQMPIWIALYAVLQSTFELRQAPFLWNWTWIHDLSQPDYIYQFAHPATVWFFTIRGINLLPVLLSIAMMAQQKFMPKPMAATPEQMKQQQMMQWLSPIMFLFFFYNLPSGLNLYIFTSTAVGVIESKVIRDHLKAREEAEKAGRVFVSTKATRGSKQNRSLEPPPPRKQGMIGRLIGPAVSAWIKMQEQAEQVKQERENPRGKKKV